MLTSYIENAAPEFKLGGGITIYFACTLTVRFREITYMNPFSASDAGNGVVGRGTDRITAPIHDLLQTCKKLVVEATLANLFPNQLGGIHLRCVWRDVLLDVVSRRTGAHTLLTPAYLGLLIRPTPASSWNIMRLSSPLFFILCR